MVAYRAHHGLTGPAFGKGIANANMLVYPHLKEFAEEVDTLIDEGGIGILTGEMGIGKTTALRHCFAKLDEHALHVCYHGSSRHSLAILEAIVESLGAAPARLRSTLLRQITQRVARAHHEQRKKTLIVVDDAQMLDDNLLEDLRLLTNFEMDAHDPLILLLVGHPSLRLRLQRPVHLALWDRVRMHYRLEGLSSKETAEYIDCHMRDAGGNGDTFASDAKNAIFDHAQGIPRRINDLALTLLKKSAQRSLKKIDAKFVGTVIPLLRKD